MSKKNNIIRLYFAIDMEAKYKAFLFWSVCHLVYALLWNYLIDFDEIC